MGKFLLILLMLASTSTLAAINKWVDDQGTVHYSDQPPPPGQHPKSLHGDANTEDSASSGASDTQTLAEHEAETKKQNAENQAAADKAAQKQAADEARKANCSTAQQNLRNLQSGIRIMEVDAKGESSYIDDTQRQQRLDKAQQDISKYCN